MPQTTLKKYPLSPKAIKTNQALIQLIRDKIKENNGFLPFDRYMELALYAPNLGYYSAGSQKFGQAGDFITAPEMTPIFSQCLANQAIEIFEKTNLPAHFLEFGAGSGKMAVDLLVYLEKQQILPKSYTILELSADLKQRQQTLVQQQSPAIQKIVKWIDCLPTEKFKGIILANELLDAMPVSLFKTTEKGCLEYFIGIDNHQFKGFWRKPINKTLNKAVEQLKQQYPALNQAGYISEINLRLPAWFKSIDDCTEQAAIILIDYGHKGSDYYHQERSSGSLSCHYRHQSHTDPLILTGLQDITADVDFSAVAQIAKEIDWQCCGYTSQSNFLMGCNLEQLLNQAVEQDKNILQLSQPIKQLMLPEFMGEKFKVIGFVKNLSKISFNGFSKQLNLKN